MVSGLDALKRLRQGNRRFADDIRGTGKGKLGTRRIELMDGQNPIAIILGCSDSRVPAELIFDQGLGDLFVIRVAGNIVAPSQVGSVEFAAERYGSRLVVVLGHSLCGAVQATLEELERPGQQRSPNLGAIVGRIRPAVETLMEADWGDSQDALLRAAIRSNTRASANHLRNASPTLEKMIRENELLVVGAEYSLETGFVDFFDVPPGQ